MAENISTTSNNSKDYQKQLLNTMVVAPVFEQFALRGKITGTKNVVWNRINRLSPGSPAPIGLGVTPSPMIQTPDEITASADWYAAFTKIARQAFATDPNGQTKQMGVAMGKHGSELREVIIRNAVVSGATSTYYAGFAPGAGSRATVASVANLTDLGRINRALYASGAEQITDIVKAGNGQGTTPIGASYICIIHGHVENDIRALSGFVPVEKYPNSAPGFVGEIGSVPGYRFIKSNIMSDMYYASAGGAWGSNKLSDNSTNCNVYPCLIFGVQAFGVVDLEKFETITKDLESAGSAVNAYATTGYIMAMVAKVLNGAWVAVYECASTL